MRYVGPISIVIAALASNLGLLALEGSPELAPGPQDAAGHAELKRGQEPPARHPLSDDPDLAEAIRKLRPEASKWTLRAPDGSIAYRRRSVFVDFPPHKTTCRARLYRSYFCQERGEERRWRCSRRSKKTLALVPPASDLIVGSEACPATVRGIEVHDGIDAGMIPDLVDFLRSSPMGQDGAMERFCRNSPPTCQVNSVKLTDAGRHHVMVTISPFRWLAITMDVTCLGEKCRFERLSCAETVS